jgi:hypothetical protein
VRGAALTFFLIFFAAHTAAQSILDGGHAKVRLTLADFPDDSFNAQFLDPPAFDQGADLRLKLRYGDSAWKAEADYQLIGQFGDSLEFQRTVSGLIPGGGVQNDSRRLMDLTWTISEGNEYHSLHRFDRMAVGYTGEKWVGKVGRQAISWGNGMVFNPMDIFNPFDPAAVDKEYKSGDDMAYGQYLRDNGDDLQAVWVVRRDADENLTDEVNSLAVKYHGFAGDAEYDLLAASHYEDWIVAGGGSFSWGGAIVRGDLTVTDTEDDTVLSAVTSLSYSWVGFGKNMSGVLEYYHNGFGLQEGFNQADLENNPDLLSRLARGELFNLGKHYLGGGVLVEMSPLFSLTPNMFLNLADQSFLAQLVANWDVSQNWQMLLALNLPVGDQGTEFGGFESTLEGVEFSQGASVFTQLAIYF